jgi:hypothetical protein
VKSRPIGLWGVTQQKKASGRRVGLAHRSLERFEIDLEFGGGGVDGLERNVDQATALQAGGSEKWRIDRREGDRLFIGGTTGPDREVDAEDEPRKPDDPVRFDLPPIPALVVVDEQRRQIPWR